MLQASEKLRQRLMELFSQLKDSNAISLDLKECIVNILDNQNDANVIQNMKDILFEKIEKEVNEDKYECVVYIEEVK